MNSEGSQPDQAPAKVPVLLLEDDVPVRRAIAERIESGGRFLVTESLGTLAEARSAFENTVAQLAVFDLRLPDGDATSIIPLARRGNVDVLVLTVSDLASDVLGALAAGAGGYVLKAEALNAVPEALLALHAGLAPMSPSIARALSSVAGGANRPSTLRQQLTAVQLDAMDLTPRETGVMEALAQGLTYVEISRRLDISLNTVRAHIRNIYRKLEAKSRHEALGKLGRD